MIKLTSPNRHYVFIGLFLSLAMTTLLGRAKAEDGIAWLELDTRYTTLRYQSAGDLEIFDEKIDFFPTSSTYGLRLLSSDPGSKDPNARIKEKVDALYSRVQEILGMRKKMDRVKINIYHDKKQLEEAFYNLYAEDATYRAWYIFEENTVYITVADLHEGMLAHEIAHSIIDHYLTVRPPPMSAEILARYVDSHLHD